MTDAQWFARYQLVFQCRCCPDRWYAWPHIYAPPRELARQVRWRIVERS